MVELAQIEISNDGDDEYQTQGAVNLKLFIECQKTLSENFNVEIDAWARQALAANGFGDY